MLELVLDPPTHGVTRLLRFIMRYTVLGYAHLLPG